MSSASEFGKDFGLVSEAVVTGRKAGWGHDVWKKLAHDENLMRTLLPAIQGRAEVTIKSRLTNSTVTTLPALKKPKRLKDCGVCSWGNATKPFASVDKLPAIKKHAVEYRDLIEPLDDFNLIEELGGEDAAVFSSVAEVETTISQFIAEQPNGASGHMLSDGKANLFYVHDPENHERVLYVSVCWDSDGSQWSVDCDPADTKQWRAERRVFKATVA
ncbi:MAG: hypothetical protein R3B69_03025 [Candidatus Paceibacterota bacterium]